MAISLHEILTAISLQGSIDQVDDLIYFDTKAKELQQWDNQIQAICSQVNQIMENCIAKNIEAI